MIVNSFTEGIENIPDTDYVMEDPVGHFHLHAQKQKGNCLIEA